MGLIRTELMPDSSEVVPYDHAGNSFVYPGGHILLLIITCVLPATGMMILNGSILSLEK